MPSAQEVKEYLDRRFGKESALLHSIRVDSHESRELPQIQIPIHVGRFLSLLVKIQAPRQILEIGTLGGYSAAWLATFLSPEGRLISLEVNSCHAERARKNLEGLKHVEVRTGYATLLLAELVERKEGPFDLIFIDADKENQALYLEWALCLSRSGTLILIDNLIPKGPKVGYPSNEEAKSVYAFNDYLATHPKLQVAAIPTIVSEGRLDALAIAYVI